jgi:hypothetical protein
VIQQIYVYTDHGTAIYSLETEILYVDSPGTSRLLDMEPETDIKIVYQFDQLKKIVPAINCALRHYEVQRNGDKSVRMFNWKTCFASRGKILIAQETGRTPYSFLSLW